MIISDPAYAGLINRIRLAGGVTRLVPLRVVDGGWRLDLEALAEAASAKTRVVLTMSPSMPSGIVHTPRRVASDRRCRAADRRLAPARRGDGAYPVRRGASPAPGPDTGTCREDRDGRQRLQGIPDDRLARGLDRRPRRDHAGHRAGQPDQRGLPGGHRACQGAAAALTAEDDGIAAAVAEWQARRDVILKELSDLPVVRPDGGWSLLIDTVALGMSPADASQRLFETGKIAATPMTGWGSEENAGRFMRFVFANEPCERLVGLRERVRAAWSL